MRDPISFRHGIPFFTQKSPSEYKADQYERYYEVVTRQIMIHTMDHLWENYRYQQVLDYVTDHIALTHPSSVLDIGCGVGRLIAELAGRLPSSDCWGLDFSYQMVRQARQIWVESDPVDIDLSHKGFTQQNLSANASLKNLQFGLARAENLPFDDDSLDLVVSSFALDRFDKLALSLNEIYRVLCPGGQFIGINAQNYQHAEDWQSYYPADQFMSALERKGFTILDVTEDLRIKEPLDRHGNHIEWSCLAFSVRK